MKHCNKLTVLLGALMAAPAMAANTSLGVVVDQSGVGVSLAGAVAGTSNQQWRLQVSGLSASDAKSDRYDSFEINDNRYNGEIELEGGRISADFYPFSSNQIFFTSGLGYLKSDIDVTSTGSYNIGNSKSVNDGSSMRVELDQSTIAPFVGIGWGNRLAKRNGLGLFFEIGMMMPLNDADVTVSTTSSTVSDADVESERRSIKDSMSDIRTLATVGLTIRF